MRRREFLYSATGAASVPLFAQTPAKTIDESDPGNVKLCHRIDAKTITDDDLRFLQQIGLPWVRLEYGAEEVSLDTLRAAQQRFAGFGMRIYSVVHAAYRSTKIQLGRPGRDQDIETYARVLRHLGTLGIPVAAYDFHPANTYTTRMVQHRGYTTREFDLNDFRARVEKQQFDREYSADEMWANYTYFMKAILPVAEEAGVTMALHPDDPPVSKMNGVAKLFTHYDGYHRAEQIAGGSRNWGLTFCCGTWAEGGDRMGKNVFEMVRDFGGRGKIFEIHFRSVTSPLPTFVETFQDEGYLDMYQVMKTLREVRYHGAAEPDHVPRLAGDGAMPHAGTAFCIAYMRALLRRANAEVG